MQVSPRCGSGFNWDSFRTCKRNGPSESSQDEFMRLRIHPGRPRLTSSSGYEFIDWDLAGRIHQGRSLGWRIHRTTNSSCETLQNEFIKWGILPDESNGLRIHRVCSRLTKWSGYEFIEGDSRRTNSSCEKWTPQAMRTAAISATRSQSHDPPRDGYPLKAY